MKPTIAYLSHFIGNPLFAIETSLEPLRRRIREGRKIEAFEVVDTIEAAVNRAKRNLLLIIDELEDDEPDADVPMQD